MSRRHPNARTWSRLGTPSQIGGIKCISWERHERPPHALKGHSGCWRAAASATRPTTSPSLPPPHTYPFIGYVGVVGGGCRTSVLMPGAGQDTAVAAKMAAPHTGGPQFIAADARGAAVGNAVATSCDPPGGRITLTGGLNYPHEGFGFPCL